MKKALLVLALAGLVVVQATWLPLFRIGGLMPDAVLVALVTWALLVGGMPVIPLAASAGLLLDLIAGAPLGLSAAGLLVAIATVGWWRGTVFYPGIGIFVAAAVVGTVAYDATLLVGMQSLHDPVDWSAAVRRVMVPSAALNAGLAVPAGFVLSSMARRLGALKAAEHHRIDR